MTDEVYRCQHCKRFFDENSFLEPDVVDEVRLIATSCCDCIARGVVACAVDIATARAKLDTFGFELREGEAAPAVRSWGYAVKVLSSRGGND